MQAIVEAFASICGLLSVVLAARMSILVYPVGIVSTAIYIIIMFRSHLYGDALVNVVYTVMSIYGWVKWTQKDETQPRRATVRELVIGAVMFVASFCGVGLIYYLSGETINWLDTVSTAIFVVAMWYMALQAIESWVLWLIGDAVSVGKVAIKGLYFTTFQYAVLTTMAVWGFTEWYKQVQHREFKHLEDEESSTTEEP